MKRRAVFFLLVLIFLAVGIRLTGLHAYLDQARIRESIEGFGSAGPLVYILIFAVAPALFLPGLPFTIAGGLAFGPVWGTVYASVGSTLGAGVAFLVARYFARDAIRELLGERWKWVDAGVSKKGWVYVALTRLVPIFPFNLLNYAFGLTGISFGVYLAVSWLFMLPATAAFVVFSSSLLGLLKGDISPAFLIGLFLLLIVALIPFVYRKWKGTKGVLTSFIGVIVLSAPVLCALPGSASSEEKAPIRLLTDAQAPDGAPEGWRPLTFKNISRHTDYRLIHEAGRPVIRAESRRSASGLYRPLDLDPKEYPFLSWCWKIDRIIVKGDEARKEGDDYAARIYVTFKFDPDQAPFWERMKFRAIKLVYGEYPPKGAINYIWANYLPKGRSIANAYTDRARMVAVESGPEKVGRWVCEARKIDDDYQSLFGEAPPTLSGVAVMTDTDNTGEEATASYADLILEPALRKPSGGE
ncbi:MAG TPA: DUF3047 domain-containing protein [Candidatus Manganitrophaceae bacterium]